MEQQNNTTKKKVLKRLFLGIGILFLLVVVLYLIFPIFANLLSSDISDIDDSHMLLTDVPYIPTEENAYYDLAEIETEERLEVDENQTGSIMRDHLTGEVWQEEYVEELLDKNEEALRIFDVAVDKPYYQNPIIEMYVSRDYDIDLHAEHYITLTLRSIGRINTIRAMDLLKQNRHEEAFNAAMKNVRLGAMIGESKKYTIDNMAAFRIKELGISVAVQAIEEHEFSTEEALEYMQELENYKYNRDSIKTSYRFYYTRVASLVDGFAEKDEQVLDYYNMGSWIESHERTFDNSFYFKPNKTKQMFLDDVELLLDLIEYPCNEIIEKNNETPWVDPISKYTNPTSLLDYRHPRFMENFVGKVHVSIAGSVRDNLSTIQDMCMDEFRVDSFQIILALEAYNNDHGYYPDALESLLFDYIEDHPQNPFSGEPMRYTIEDGSIIFHSDSIKEEYSDIKFNTNS